jgi:formate dehydrogenase maturation protein FdhE
VAARFVARAERAAALADAPSAGREPLRFAAGLHAQQAAVVRALAGRELGGELARDQPFVELAPLAAYVAAHGPPGLRAADPASIDDFWRGDRSGASHPLARALLRPYVELLHALGVRPEPGGRGGCGFCGGGFASAVRRPLGDSARRALVCALCGAEEAVGRIQCPACAEGDPAKLPTFASERHPAARIEACASCRLYLKSIDLGVDGRAHAEVDDLASLALDLWAQDEGYRRLEPGLAGV